MPRGRKRTLGDTVPESERARTLVLDAGAALARLVRHFADGEHVEIGRDAADELVRLSNAAAAVGTSAVVRARQVPWLPDDALRTVAEFVLARRACATFGAGGVVQTRRSPLYDYACRTGWDVMHEQLRAVRAINRQWRSVVTPLVRCIWLPPEPSAKNEQALEKSFSHVTLIGGHFRLFGSFVQNMVETHGDRASLIIGNRHVGSITISDRPYGTREPLIDEAGRCHGIERPLAYLLQNCDVGHFDNRWDTRLCSVQTIRLRRLFMCIESLNVGQLAAIDWPDGFELHVQFYTGYWQHDCYRVFQLHDSKISHFYLDFNDDNMSDDDLATVASDVPDGVRDTFATRYTLTRNARLYSKLLNYTGRVVP